MRFAITPLGASGGRSVGEAVRDIVRYLRAGPDGLLPGGASGADAVRYYADSGEGTGR